jgi:RNA polymerase sigma factor (sigma-70 family)
MAVLTAAIFIIVAGAVAAMTLMNATVFGLYRIGATRAYAAGFLTSAMLLVGAGGAWAHVEGVTNAPWRVVRAETELAKVAGPRGAFDAGLKALCLGAGETEPKLARRREAAPGCRFLPGATGGNNADDDCFASLLPFVPEARRSLRRDFRLNAYDADDVAMEALLATCTAKTEVRDRRLYFFRVARNQAKKEVMSRRRDVSCAVLDDARVTADLGCTLDDPPELKERKLAWLWDKVLCDLDEPAARIVRSRLVDDLSFREAGKLWGMTEEKARDTFHNAVKKVRRLRLAECFRD